MKKTFPHRCCVFFYVVVSTLLATGCGEPPTTTSNELGKDSLTNLKLLIDWKAEPTYAGFYIAQELGFFEEAGIDIDIVEGNGATTAAQVIGVGSDYVIGSSSGVATAVARSKSIPVKSVGVIYHEIPTVIYSLADRPISEPTDLYDKRIGLITGSTSLDEYRALVIANNINRSQVKEIEVGWDVAPLLSGQIDGLLNYAELTPVKLQLQGYDVKQLRLADFGVNAYGLNLITNESFLADNPSIVRAVVTASSRGYEVVRDDPGRAAKIFSRMFPEKSADYVAASLAVVSAQLAPENVLNQTVTGWTDSLNMMNTLGLIDGSLSPLDVAASGFLNE